MQTTDSLDFCALRNDIPGAANAAVGHRSRERSLGMRPVGPDRSHPTAQIARGVIVNPALIAMTPA